jgi:hypothetical protein
MGPTGPAGTAGATGAQGIQGIQGIPGNADVQAFLFLNVGFSLFTPQKFLIPAITQGIVDQGTVLAYVRPSGTSSGWYPLPFTNGSNTINLYDFQVGFAEVQANFSQAGGFDWRFVVVSGTALTQLNVSHLHLNFNNYGEVAAAFHLSN